MSEVPKARPFPEDYFATCARLFVGRRTAATHVGRAYGKLGVRTKPELIALVFDRHASR